MSTSASHARFVRNLNKKSKKSEDDFENNGVDPNVYILTNTPAQPRNKKKSASRSDGKLLLGEVTPVPNDAHAVKPKGELAVKSDWIDDPEGYFFGENDGMETLACQYATAAISYLLKKKGQNLVLVKPLLHHIGPVIGGWRVHFNFQAKRADDPSAPVETYFGQLRDYGNPHFAVECCVSLGRSDKLPDKRYNRGCQYCTRFVHHPVGRCEGIIWGHLKWSEKDKNYVIV